MTDKVREALEPFAKIDLWRDTYPDAKADILAARQLQGYIRVEDVRRAREALASLTSQPKGKCQRPPSPAWNDGWNYCPLCGARNDSPCALASPPKGEEGIDAAAQWLAENVTGRSWDELRNDGRASDGGFNPWHGANARQEDFRDAIRAILSRLSRPVTVPDGIPIADWKIVVDERVLIYVVHPNAQYERDEKRRKDEWESWCVGRWIEHNAGGWTWHGMSGTVTHVAPLPASPSPSKAKG